MNAQTTSDLVELSNRYLSDWLAAGVHHSEWTFEEVDVIRQAVADRFPDEDSAILFAYTSIEAEFTRGHRCGVCGRTRKQNDAIGYNCAEQC